MDFTSTIALLQSALMLLSLVSGMPDAPQALREQAIQLANTAIQKAMTMQAAPVSQPATGETNEVLKLLAATGPERLVVGEVGTWTLSGRNSTGLPMTYSIDWGDASASSTQWFSFPGSATTTHAYAKAASSTITFKIRSSSGLQVRASLPIHVSGVSSCMVELECSLGMHGVISGKDPGGCPVLLCVDDRATCKEYAPIMCPAGQYAQSPGISADSCPLAARCVAEVVPAVWFSASSFYSGGSASQAITGYASTKGFIRIVVLDSTNSAVYDSGIMTVSAGPWSVHPASVTSRGDFVVKVLSSSGAELARVPFYVVGQ